MIETTRLLIREFRADDWRDLHAYLSDPDVVRYEPYDVFSEEDSRQAATDRATDDAFWAVCLKESGRLIGNLFLQQQPFATWELGYVFNAGDQGHGYATEAARALLAYTFAELEARRIVAMCDPRNAPSWRLLERLGLRREGHLLQTGYFKTDGDGNPLWHDTYVYALLASEWQASH